VKDPDTGLLNPATAAMEADATAAIADLQSASTFAAGAALLQVDESADHLTAQPTHVEFARSDSYSAQPVRLLSRRITL